MNFNDAADRLYFAALIKKWGIRKVEKVSQFPRTTIYQWRPSRSTVPPEAALRVCEMPDAQALGYWVETLCPGLPWHLLYRGRDRRNTWDATAETLEEAIKDVGVALVARTAGRSRQNIYEAIKYPRCPVWLALAVEEASASRYLVEDFRGDVPWWPLYERHKQALPLTVASGA